LIIIMMIIMIIIILHHGADDYVAPYDKILIVCASFIFDLDTPFDSAHRDLSYEAIFTSI